MPYESSGDEGNDIGKIRWFARRCAPEMNIIGRVIWAANPF